MRPQHRCGAFLACALLLVGFSTARADDCTNAPDQSGPPPAGTTSGTVPTFDLTTLDGLRITPELIAGQVVVLDFVAPNCPWCKRHLPRMARLEQAYTPLGAVFVAVAGQIGTQIFTDEEVTAILRATGYAGPIARDLGRAAARAFGPLSRDGQMHYPATFVIGPAGEIVDMTPGYGQEDLTAAALFRLLGPPAAGVGQASPPANLPLTFPAAAAELAAENAHVSGRGMDWPFGEEPNGPTSPEALERIRAYVRETAPPSIPRGPTGLLANEIDDGPETLPATPPPPEPVDYFFHPATGRVTFMKVEDDPQTQVENILRAVEAGANDPLADPFDTARRSVRLPAWPAGVPGVRLITRAEADAAQPASPQRTLLHDLQAETLRARPNAVALATEFLNRHGWAFAQDKAAVARVAAGEPLSLVGRGQGEGSPVEIELLPTRAERDGLGMTHVRFRQHYHGLPVFGAEMIVHIGTDGKVKSANAAVGSGINLSLEPKAHEEDAIEAAKKIFADKYPYIIPDIRNVALYVLQPGLFSNANDVTSYLVWEVQLSSRAFVDESYFIDAKSGELRFWLDNVRRLNRKVYDCSAQFGEGNGCWSNFHTTYNDPKYGWTARPPDDFTFGCWETGGYTPCPHGPNPRYLPSQQSVDTDTTFTLLGDVHEYYQTKFNRNGANGAGGNTNGTTFPAIMDVGASYVDWLSSWQGICPSAAYWPATGVYFCKDVVVPDVVGHEYAHGVSPAGLIYSGESGALDENHSDVIGEMFEYWKTGGNDWVSGAGTPISAPRNLSDPPSVIDSSTGTRYPDRYTSDYFYCGSADNYGVHHNSTVPSKAHHLASMGGYFNGCTIAPIGRNKVEQVLYRVMTLYYLSSETFNAAYPHSLQACGDLYGAQSSDCRELKKALQAVEMDQVGKCADPNHEQTLPPSCLEYRGDYDRDFDLDLADVAGLQTCFSGTGSPAQPPLCRAGDTDGDDDVDIDDATAFFNCLAGPGQTPTCP